MSQASTVVLDNEAVQALMAMRHRKHRRVLAVVEAVASRNLRRGGSSRLVVPTAARVEAGWDRRVPRAAVISRLRIGDADLDTPAADRAAVLRATLAVSVADAHLGAVLGTTDAPHAVVTSDPDDVRRLASHLGHTANIVRI